METDDVLIQRIREGDDDAFGEIVDRYKDPLVNYLTHLVRSRDRAEEIAQDAFVRLYRNVDKYRERERLAPYLFRIATNLVVSEARRDKRWTLLLPRLQASSRRSAPSPETVVMADEIQREVSAALSRLPIKYRAPLVLFEIEEWSYEEIGKALELRNGTVKSRISRAREMLRKSLAPWWRPLDGGIGGQRNERDRASRLDATPAAHEGIARIQV
jgi:RNA polymerase sigma-70 factor, ECF subfamily